MSQDEAGTPGMAFKSNTEIAIHVPNLDEAKAFYEGVLGFRLVRAIEQ